MFLRYFRNLWWWLRGIEYRMASRWFACLLLAYLKAVRNAFQWLQKCKLTHDYCLPQGVFPAERGRVVGKKQPCANRFFHQSVTGTPFQSGSIYLIIHIVWGNASLKSNFTQYFFEYFNKIIHLKNVQIFSDELFILIHIKFSTTFDFKNFDTLDIARKMNIFSKLNSLNL